jgi:serine/threonine protein phosphatase PrpC
MALALNIGKCTLLGNYRENNEDAVDVKQYPDLTVCVVADGMGGQQAGEIASKQAIEVLPRELKKNLVNVTDQDRTRQLIREAVVQANAIIMEMASLDRDLTNMGTTVVMAVWRKGSNTIYIASIGDSRAYLLRGSKLEQLTIDHSIAQALVEAKTITPADARTHKYRNVLWKYLGSKEVGEGPDVKAITVNVGDRLLLCTDGLTGFVPDDQLVPFIQEHMNIQDCADGLGQLALDAGSKDNVSCIVIEVTETK